MKFLLYLCLILLPSIAFADARNGELFGYKIGEVYPVTESTIRGQWDEISKNEPTLEIVAETPKKPKNIGEVGVLLL